MPLRDRVRTKVLEALQHPRVTAMIANPAVVRATMTVVAAQARLERLEGRLTTAVAHTFNLPTRDEAIALKSTIQRLETRLRALEDSLDHRTANETKDPS